jgi:hypothetical protein
VLDPLVEDALVVVQGVTSRYFAGKASELVASRMKEWNERRTQEFRSLLLEEGFFNSKQRTNDMLFQPLAGAPDVQGKHVGRRRRAGQSSRVAW